MVVYFAVALVVVLLVFYFASEHATSTPTHTQEVKSKVPAAKNVVMPKQPTNLALYGKAISAVTNPSLIKGNQHYKAFTAAIKEPLFDVTIFNMLYHLQTSNRLTAKNLAKVLKNDRTNWDTTGPNAY
jgi:hypothetical protein